MVASKDTFMPTSFEFASAQRIIFGEGKAAAIAALAAELGERALVITGNTAGRVEKLVSEWHAKGLVAQTLQISGEPAVDDVIAAGAAAAEAGCDLVIAIGGGSVIDTGKAVAALLTNPGDPLEYLEVVGRGRPLTVASAPLIAAPTTAGTGAEVTRNAVLSVPEKQVKVSLRSATMLPRIALVDPELTYSMPPAITASTGLDALTQCIEPYVSNQANALTDGIACQGMQAAARGLLAAHKDGSNKSARSDMALASLCGGLALANAKLGAVHGFAGVIGGMFPIPHGVVCARLLPFVMAANVAAVSARNPNSGYRARFDHIARILTGETNATAHEAVEWLHTLCTKLNIPPLNSYGVTPSAFDEIIAKSKVASSMKGNPISLSDHELFHILNSAL
jgi:alcohol dehydrogenase class IV